MARILDVTINGSPKIRWTLDATLGKRTPTSQVVNYTLGVSIANSGGWLGSGHTLVGYVNGSAYTLKASSGRIDYPWSNSTSFSHTHSVGAGATTITPTFQGVNGYGNAGDCPFRNCASLAVPSSYANYNSVALAAVVESQRKVILDFTGLPEKVGYDTTIKWYDGDALLGSTSNPNNATTAYSFEVDSLHPNTSHLFKAEVFYNSTSMAAKTVAVTTNAETGEIEVVPKATYLTISVSEMFENPAYARTLEIYYKKTSDADYTLAATLESSADTAGYIITGLISNLPYDVKILIKNGTTTIRTMERIEVYTLQDTSLIPLPDIESITQQLGTRNCTINWLADKAVAGTTYKIEAKAEGDAAWTNLATFTAVTSPTIIISHAGNKNVTFRIGAENESVAYGIINYSDLVTFYVRDDFVWDTAKVSGWPLNITANEWNRLREYAVARNNDLGISVDIPVVKRGDAISAAVYNAMKAAISNVTHIDIGDKVRGDAITAADVDALRVAINTVVA